MNTALWIVAGVLAFVFVGSGVLKLVASKDKLVAAGQGWAADVDANAIRAIGAAEVAGAIGLIVPPLVHILPVLTPLAAVGLAGRRSSPQAMAAGAGAAGGSTPHRRVRTPGHR